MAKRKVTELVTYEVDAAEFPGLKGALSEDECAEISEKDFEALKAFAKSRILDVAISRSYQYGRNGSAYIACVCADTTGGRRRKARDSVSRILDRCHQLQRCVEKADRVSFDREAKHLVKLAQAGRLKEIRNYRFEMKCVAPNMGGGEIRTISAESREKAEELYWAWSSFRRRPNPDGTHDGYCGKYRLAVTQC